MIFLTITWRATSMDKAILTNSQVATKIGIHHRLFCVDNFISKNFKKLSLVESLFNIRLEYSLQTTTLLNSVTDDFMKAFWNSCAENLSEKPIIWKLSEEHMWSCILIQLHEYNLQPTTGQHYRDILEVLRKERIYVLKFLKFQKKSFWNCPSFSNATVLQFRISDFRKYSFQEKCFFGVFWNSWKLAKKVYNEVIWLTKSFYKNHFIHFSVDVRKNCCYESFGKLSEKHL